jgi:signal transduction histidine kinase
MNPSTKSTRDKVNLVPGVFQDQKVVLRESASDNQKDLLRAVLGSTDYGFMLTDLNHVTIACNGEFGRLFGVDVEEVVRNNVAVVRRMVMERIADLPAWEANLDTVYADPYRVHLDELLLKNPTARLRRWTGPVLSSSGKAAGRLWTFLDVTKEARLRAMRETLAEVSTYFHPEPGEVSRHLVNLVGKHYQSVSLLSVQVGDFMEFRAVGGPDSPAKSIAGNRLEESYCQFCLNVNEPFLIQDAGAQVEYSHLLPAKIGMSRYAGVPVRDPSGKAIGTLCILDSRSDELLDSDDLRFLELVALRISSELDRDLRIRALQNDVLARDESLRRAHSELIRNEKLAVTGMFSAAIAHDIRNILSAVSLDVSLSEGNPKEGLKKVQRHLNRFDILSHRLLSYVRPSEISLQAVRLAKVIDTVLALLEAHLQISGIRTELCLVSRMPSVRADPIRLEHLFVNLIMNAIQAMPSGGCLTIRSSAEPDFVKVELSDTGKGMQKAQLSRLFEAFGSNRRDGFGLGLFSCKQIMTEIGGTISVKSQINKGTTFSLKFPTHARNSNH